MFWAVLDCGGLYLGALDCTWLGVVNDYDIDKVADDDLDNDYGGGDD